MAFSENINYKVNEIKSTPLEPSVYFNAYDSYEKTKWLFQWEQFIAHLPEGSPLSEIRIIPEALRKIGLDWKCDIISFHKSIYDTSAIELRYTCPHGQDFFRAMQIFDLMPIDMVCQAELKIVYMNCFQECCIKPITNAFATSMPDDAYKTYQPETKKSTALQEAIGVIQENLGLEKEIPKNPLGGSYQILLLLRQYFPDVMKFKTTCPHMTCLVKDNIWEVQKLIPHVNDRHKWNREQIADWIETLDVDITIKQSKS